MSSEFEDKPFSENHLESPEYRLRLMRKLNTLIAVLEVACAKVRRSLVSPEADTERLNRIHKNLKDTLQVCLRAKRALERCERLPDGLPSSLTKGIELSSAARAAAKKAAPDVELSSAAEKDKFSRLNPIDPTEVRSVDIGDLCRRLQE